MAVCRRGAGRGRHRGAPGRAGRHRLRPRPQAARQDRQDQLPAPADAAGRGQAAGVLDPPGHILECRALLELYNDLRAEHTAWAQRIHAVLFHQGAPALGEGTLRSEQGLAALREAAAAHLSPAGQLHVATALDMLTSLEARMHVLRHQLLDAARHLTGARSSPRRYTGRAGHRAGADLLARRPGPVLLLPQGGPVRRAGHHRLLLRPQGAAGRLSRQGPPVLRWAVYEAGKTHARSTAPDHAYYAQVKDGNGGKRATLSEARKIIRQACHILTELGDDALTAA